MGKNMRSPKKEGLCRRCNQRRAIAFRWRERPGTKAVVKLVKDKDHDMCPQCFRELNNSLRAHDMKEDE